MHENFKICVAVTPAGDMELSVSIEGKLDAVPGVQILQSIKRLVEDMLDSHNSTVDQRFRTLPEKNKNEGSRKFLSEFDNIDNIVLTHISLKGGVTC